MTSSTGRTAVILVGFMGAGKSSVGQALAQLLGWNFVDLDERIEAQEHRSVQEIFRNSGEEAFRRAETQALRALLQKVAANSSPGTVAALGGGAFIQQENASMLRDSGLPSIFLDAPVETLRERCMDAGASRPLFNDENQFRQLYERRRRDYMKADFRVDTSGKSVGQVAAEVVKILGWDGADDRQ